MAPEEKPKEKPAQRAIKKIRTASLVISLARGWQQWANENSTRQAQEPSGWLPGGAKEAEESPKENKNMKPLEPLQEKQGIEGGQRCLWAKQFSSRDRDCQNNLADEPGETHIKRKEVTKTVVNKVYERGGDISLLSHRYENDGTDSESCQEGKDLDHIDKILNSHTSPTRRRKCLNLVSELTKGWKEIEQEEPTSRSDSIDTEDSGYGGDSEERLEQEVNRQEGDHVTAARIKRPTPSQARRFSENLSSKAQRKFSQVNSMTGRWQKWADEHMQSQKLNPFSEEFDHELAMSTRLHKGDEGYGRPKEGTKTAERAKQAEEHIYREIMDLCFVIRTMARHRRDGKIQVTFGELFDRYVRISDKVVGILMRARKHGLVHFEGEMLWQGRDDHVVITLLE
ncbi:actin-binding Rho-activating protein [Dromiciops gliroides]|uniref:actin-binding Rho-activating protein n=1 Tax=Dromiciops gliroides TaxID=33562 RepID=UPI001CC5451D|nr:actin-binding Rho-activating protein [Dromiciops gliroides]